MKFYAVVEQVIALLQREGRGSYRALKREFALDDEYPKDLKAELIETKRLAVDEDGKVLVWTDGAQEQEAGNRRGGEMEEEEEWMEWKGAVVMLEAWQKALQGVLRSASTTGH